MNGVIVDQEGNEVRMEDVRKEQSLEMSRYLESKRPEFEKAMKARCEEKNEIFANMGFTPQVGTIAYQVGMEVYILTHNSAGIDFRVVGVIR